MFFGKNKNKDIKVVRKDLFIIPEENIHTMKEDILLSEKKGKEPKRESLVSEKKAISQESKEGGFLNSIFSFAPKNEKVSTAVEKKESPFFSSEENSDKGKIEKDNLGLQKDESKKYDPRTELGKDDLEERDLQAVSDSNQESKEGGFLNSIFSSAPKNEKKGSIVEKKEEKKPSKDHFSGKKKGVQDEKNKPGFFSKIFSGESDLAEDKKEKKYYKEPEDRDVSLKKNDDLSVKNNVYGDIFAGREIENSVSENFTVEKKYNSAITISGGSQGKGFAWIFFVLFFVSLAGGGFYFWQTRIKEKELEKKIPGFVDKIKTGVHEPEKKLFSERPNLLVLKKENFSQSVFRQKILEIAERVYSEGHDSSLEFFLVDEFNNPFQFSFFSEKIGMSVPSEISGFLGKRFSLFVYNDNGNKRLALVVEFFEENEENLRKSILEKEADFARAMSPLFLVSNYSSGEENFGQSSYSNVEVRFTNIISPEELSVDYAIYEGRLFVGTTKMTLRKTLDRYLSEEGL